MGMENYSLADIRAATRDNECCNNDGWGNGNGGWFWIVVLFLFMFGFGGNGFGGFGNNAGFQGALTRSDMCDEFNSQDIKNGVRGIQQGLCDGFYAMNTTTLQGFHGVDNAICNLGYQAGQLASGINANIQESRFAAQQCCCETNRNIDAVRAENYRNTCDITTAIHREGEETRALINANTMQALRDKVAERDREIMARDFQLSQQAQNAYLVEQLRPCSKPAYLTCSPYEATNLVRRGCGGCGGYTETVQYA